MDKPPEILVSTNESAQALFEIRTKHPDGRKIEFFLRRKMRFQRFSQLLKGGTSCGRETAPLERFQRRGEQAIQSPMLVDDLSDH